MSTEENKALLRRFYAEVLTKGNLAVIDELVANDVVSHILPPGLPPGPEGLKMFIGMFRAAFPDLNATVEDQIAEGDKVVSRVTVRGTHTGAFQGIPPTGKQATVQTIDIIRLAGGKQVEAWGGPDQLSLLQQLGVVPMPGQ
jgi:steroid delta-isomerase-like uncharacterized protein